MRIVRWPIRNIERKKNITSFVRDIISFVRINISYKRNNISYGNISFFQCPLWATVVYLFSTEIGNLLQYKRVPYSQRYLFNANSDTNHNANPTNHNSNSKR